MICKIYIFIINLTIIFFIAGCTSPTDIKETAHNEQFVKIQLQYSFADELNTFEGVFTKDLVMDGSITVEFWLSTEDQESIKAIADQLSFFNLPKIISAMPNAVITPDPSPDRLRIQIGNRDNTVVWSYPNDLENKNFKSVIELSTFIMSIVHNNEIYKTLPEARGGRL